MIKRGVINNKSGQVTIFIIIGIIIVAASVLIYTFYPKIKSSFTGEESSPQAYMQLCVEDKLSEVVNTVASQGGNLNSKNALFYKGVGIEYLCYTEELYAPCIVQQPMLTQHIASQIEEGIKETVDECFDSLQESYKKKGYTVNLRRGFEDVELYPTKIVSTYNHTFTITKGDNAETYKSFVITTDNNLYELALLSNNILEWESTFGDADEKMYMIYYPNIKAEKIRKESGEKIYILTNRETGDVFRFAVKSLIWSAINTPIGI
jgi:flagellar basal body-associated protein FliL